MSNYVGRLRNPSTMDGEPTEIDWARLAAFIDGEGSILLTKLARKLTTRNGGFIVFIRVCVANTDPRLIWWCRDRFGGAILRDGRLAKRYKGKGYKPCYKWTANCRHGAWILENCLPYFIIKREQAEVAMAFQATVKHRGKVPMSGAEIEYRERLFAESTTLKHMTIPEGTPVDASLLDPNLLIN